MSVKFDFKTLETGFEADWPVTVNVPQDGGGIEKQEFLARFRTLTPEESDKAQQAADPNTWPNAFLVALVETGAPELTDELRKQLLGRSYVRQGLITAYVQFSQGVAAKN